MATYHFSVKFGGKGKALGHANYITREGEYSRRTDLQFAEHGNMPEWANEHPEHFWCASDQFERANGSTYREFEVALPRELSEEGQKELVRDFVRQELGDKHAYSFAIHSPKASIEGGEQPHAHIMMSMRANDGLARGPEQYFKRYNAKFPERGGARKDSGHSLTLQEQKDALIALRERWATTHNAHLVRAGIGHELVDHRSLKERGIDRLPETHLGFKAVERMGSEAKVSLKQAREISFFEQKAIEQNLAIDFYDDKWLAGYKQQMEAFKPTFGGLFDRILQDIQQERGYKLAQPKLNRDGSLSLTKVTHGRGIRY